MQPALKGSLHQPEWSGRIEYSPSLSKAWDYTLLLNFLRMYMINPRIKGQGMPDELTDAEYEQLPSDKKMFYRRSWYDDDSEVDKSVESVDISTIDLSSLLQGTNIVLSE